MDSASEAFSFPRPFEVVFSLSVLLFTLALHVSISASQVKKNPSSFCKVPESHRNSSTSCWLSLRPPAQKQHHPIVLCTRKVTASLPGEKTLHQFNTERYQTHLLSSCSIPLADGIKKQHRKEALVLINFKAFSSCPDV